MMQVEPRSFNDECTASLDADFGPGIKCAQFDFTLAFQQLIFGVVVSSLFLSWMLIRFKQVLGKSKVTAQDGMASIMLLAKSVRPSHYPESH